MHAYTDIAYITRIAIFSVTVIALAAYARWHYWWWSGYGRARMAALSSVAVLTLIPLIHAWTGVDGDFSSVPDDISGAFDLAALAGVLSWVSYIAYRLITLNIRRVRHPEETPDPARCHLKRTPAASGADVEKLLACWDEMHSRHRPG